MEHRVKSLKDFKHFAVCLFGIRKEEDMEVYEDLEALRKEIERLGAYGYLASRYGRVKGMRCMEVRGAKGQAPLYTDRFPRYPRG